MTTTASASVRTTAATDEIAISLKDVDVVKKRKRMRKDGEKDANGGRYPRPRALFTSCYLYI